MDPRRTLALFALAVLPTHSARAALSLPLNFYDTLVNSNGNMSNPTAMALAPDGRIFVCQQGGALRVIKNGSLLATPFFSLPAGTFSSAGERGLLGVAFDPGFATNRRLFIYSTHIEPSGTVTFAGAATVSGPVTYNRVTRLTADAADPDVAQAGSETLVLNMHPLSTATNHNGGAMHFGPDGKLYIAAGENANGPNAQSLGNLLGKISRIDPDGSIPGNNPFYGTAAGNNRAIWVWGLRNPFTFNFQPGTGRLFINDVGQNTWEEIDEGLSGLNFGWPTTEGDFNTGTYPSFTLPAYTYNSAGSGPTGSECAITGGTFYDPVTAQFPVSWVGRYFFADYCAGWVRTIGPPSAGTTTGTSSGFATGYNSPVGLEVGPEGALYVLTGANTGSGQVHRVHYSANAAPAILNDPSSVTILVGQNAGFTASASGAGPLTFLWQRDGSDLPNTNSPTYTLNNVQLSDDGAVFLAIVSNASGSVTSAAATLTVPPNTPPNPTILLPTLGTMFDAGATLTFSGSATDPQDGVLSAPAFTWWIDLHHDAHTHPALGATAGVTTGTFVYPNTGETSDNIWYRVYLAVTDSDGAAATIYREVFPNKTDLVLFTDPPGLDLTLEGIPVTTPATVVSVRGMVRGLGAPDQGSNNFLSWSDAGAQDHSVTVLGAAPLTFTAFFDGPTLTPTPTPVVPLRIDRPYPNPLPGGTLELPVSAPAGSRVKAEFYTTSARKVLSEEFTHPGGSVSLDLDLIDLWGDPIPNGLFWLRVMVETPSGKKVSKLFSVLVRR